MKLFNILVLISLVCATSGQVRWPNFIVRLIERSRDVINRQAINFLEGERENFPTGWPDRGIPPLEPMYIEEYETTIDALETLSAIDFRMTDANLTGLQQFKIDYLNLRVLGPTVDFDMSFDQLFINGQHSTRGSLSFIPISGSGPITMTLNDVKVKGTAQLNTINGGYLNVGSSHVTVSVGSASVSMRGFGIFLDGTISALVSAALPSSIDDSQEEINESFEEMVIGPINEVLNKHRFTDVILSLVRRLV